MKLLSFWGAEGTQGASTVICGALFFWKEKNGRMLWLTPQCSKYFIIETKQKRDKPNTYSPSHSHSLLTGPLSWAPL